MPIFTRDDIELSYEEHGAGFPVLLIAPGGMRSAVSFWEKTPWNPIEHLSPNYRVIAMDQRNAGRSVAPVRATDSWHVYTADQLALLDHLGVDRFHVAGMCIGGPYIMGLIQAASQRVASAVVFQTIGLDDNRQVFFELFDSWANELKPTRSEVSEATWESFKQSMFSGDFLFNVSRAFVSRCQTPLLVLLGNDLYHPESSSREVAALAPNATLIEHWKEPEHQPAAKKTVEEFLAKHTPR
ncbi:MAG: alpha/beta hydrolase [candidate division NC10 bacterium RIFCSPLOWO2_02_FULL_66_22]|nr:MAG: alpha/beta hydrolase [candidate division NC10 bacterium RIFCSPLOWO2_02_FULL_66_22]